MNKETPFCFPFVHCHLPSPPLCLSLALSLPSHNHFLKGQR